jgi:P4 family phage/plasmid primase-like protien
MSATYVEAIRLGEAVGWLCLPLMKRPDGRWVPPYAYAHLMDERFSLALVEQLWDGHQDAEGIGALWPVDVIEVEADSDDGTEWIRRRKPPRTPAFDSRRGPHYLFRATGARASTRPHPGVEVLSRDGGKRLLVLPPTPPKKWMPSLSPFEVEIVPLPPSFAVHASANGHKRVRIQAGPDLPPGEAHERMLAIVGRLANILPLEELWTTAKALNAGRLPDAELRAIVEDIAGKAGDVARYFDKGEGFIVPRLGNEIAEAFDIRVGAGRHLYWFRDGVFHDTGREQIEKAARRALGDRYKRRHTDELAAWFRAEQQQIPDDPPTTDLLNVRNGMLDWRTGELRPHAPEHLSIVQLPVAWDPDATCPAVDAFLMQVLPEDAQMLAREIAGYLAWPSARMRRAAMLLGAGSNGKSTLLALWRALLGRRNVSSVPLQAFGESRFAVADVYGKLANLCGDLDARALRRSDTFKTLTGGTDSVRGERKYEDAFHFVPFATLVFSANEAPASSDQTDAYFDRWIVLPFEERFEEGAGADPFLIDKLTTRQELEGLLVQAVSGLADLVERGYFDLPPSVVAANEEYRQKIDTVATFLDEGCALGVEHTVPRTRLYEAYREWCGRNGRMPIGQQSFGPRVRQILRSEIAAGSVEESKSGAVRTWRGLSVRA